MPGVRCRKVLIFLGQESNEKYYIVKRDLVRALGSRRQTSKLVSSNSPYALEIAYSVGSLDHSYNGGDEYGRGNAYRVRIAIPQRLVSLDQKDEGRCEGDMFAAADWVKG